MSAQLISLEGRSMSLQGSRSLESQKQQLMRQATSLCAVLDATLTKYSPNILSALTTKCPPQLFCSSTTSPEGISRLAKSRQLSVAARERSPQQVKTSIMADFWSENSWNTPSRSMMALAEGCRWMRASLTRMAVTRASELAVRERQQLPTRSGISRLKVLSERVSELTCISWGGPPSSASMLAVAVRANCVSSPKMSMASIKRLRVLPLLRRGDLRLRNSSSTGVSLGRVRQAGMPSKMREVMLSLLALREQELSLRASISMVKRVQMEEKSNENSSVCLLWGTAMVLESLRVLLWTRLSVGSLMLTRSCPQSRFTVRLKAEIEQKVQVRVLPFFSFSLRMPLRLRAMLLVRSVTSSQEFTAGSPLTAIRQVPAPVNCADVLPMTNSPSFCMFTKGKVKGSALSKFCMELLATGVAKMRLLPLSTCSMMRKEALVVCVYRKQLVVRLRSSMVNCRLGVSVKRGVSTSVQLTSQLQISSRASTQRLVRGESFLRKMKPPVTSVVESSRTVATRAEKHSFWLLDSLLRSRMQRSASAPAALSWQLQISSCSRQPALVSPGCRMVSAWVASSSKKERLWALVSMGQTEMVSRQFLQYLVMTLEGMVKTLVLEPQMMASQRLEEKERARSQEVYLQGRQMKVLFWMNWLSSMKWAARQKELLVKAVKKSLRVLVEQIGQQKYLPTEWERSQLLTFALIPSNRPMSRPYYSTIRLKLTALAFTAADHSTRILQALCSGLLLPSWHELLSSLLLMVRWWALLLSKQVSCTQMRKDSDCWSTCSRGREEVTCRVVSLLRVKVAQPDSAPSTSTYRGMLRLQGVQCVSLQQRMMNCCSQSAAPETTSQYY